MARCICETPGGRIQSDGKSVVGQFEQLIHPGRRSKRYFRRGCANPPGLRAGVENAYEELMDRFEHPVYSMVYRLLGNQSDACDVVQEVFLKVVSRRAFLPRAKQPAHLGVSHCRQ